MKTLRFSHTYRLDLDAQVGGHYFALRALPHDDPAQQVTIDSWSIEPLAECSQQVDGFGNLLTCGSFTEPHGYFQYSVQGTAVVESTKGRGTDFNEGYLYPSPLTQPGPSIKALYAKATPLSDREKKADVFGRAIELRRLVNESLSYDPDATGVETTAENAAKMGAGVCQDYAHILCALLRLDGTAARYVSGFMWGEGATHAWVEFFDGANWWGLDPTNDCEAGDYYVALARGRDHSDCPLESGVFRGIANQCQRVHVSVEVIDE